MEYSWISIGLYVKLIHIIIICQIQGSNRNKILVISLDGFRASYLDKYEVPNFHRLAEQGVRAEYMKPPFPPRTFPCHYTLATGLYPESHGIVANKFYDPLLQKGFNKTSREEEFWSKGEPIWISARLQGLRAGAYFWPGSGVEIRGNTANIAKPYDSSVAFQERVDVVLQWLNNSEVDIALLQLHEPNRSGHKNGPDSPNVEMAVENMDRIIGTVVDRIKGFSNPTNLIVTSDHGMATMTGDKVVDLSAILDLSQIHHKREASIGPITHIWPEPAVEDEVFRKLNNSEHAKAGNINVYRKSSVPPRYHYRSSERIPPIIVVAKEGWTCKWRVSTTQTGTQGDHGFDNDIPSMRAIFLAYGPDFKSGFKAKPFESVSVYPLLCHLLGIKPAPNNGSIDSVRHILKENAQ